MNKITSLLILIFGLSACNIGDSSVTVIKNDDNTEYIIHLNKIRDSLSIELSDIARDFKFIPFETNSECVFSSADIYVTHSYILVIKNNYGILQFDLNGKFIRTLVREGEGPEEYSRAFITVNEENQILYISDNNKDNYFLQYNIASGEYLGNINKAIPGQTKDIQYEDNSLIVIPSGGRDQNKKSYYYYKQSLSGDLLYSIEAPPGYFMGWSGKSLHFGSSAYRFHIPEDDTVYSISGEKKSPYMIFDFGEKNPKRGYVGHKSMSLNIDIGSLVYFYNFKISSIEKEGDVTYTSGAVENYVLDKRKGRANHSGQMFFNPTHHNIDGNQYQFRFTQSNGLLYYVYPAINLIEHAEKALSDPDFKEPYRSKLEQIIKNLNENDNPVLLIGSLL